MKLVSSEVGRNLNDQTLYSEDVSELNETENYTNIGIWKAPSEGEIKSTHETSNGESHGGVHIFTWEWDRVKTSWLFGAFFLVAAIIKIAYHHSPLISHLIPESW